MPLDGAELRDQLVALAEDRTPPEKLHPPVCLVEHLSSRLSIPTLTAFKVAVRVLDLALPVSSVPNRGDRLEANREDKLLAMRMFLAIDLRDLPPADPIPGLDTPAAAYEMDDQRPYELKWRNVTVRRVLASAAMRRGREIEKTASRYEWRPAALRAMATVAAESIISLLEDEAQMAQLLSHIDSEGAVEEPVTRPTVGERQTVGVQGGSEQEADSDSNPNSWPGGARSVRRRTLLRAGGLALGFAGASGASVAIWGRDRSEPVPVGIEQRLDIMGFYPLVLAGSVQAGMPVADEGCAAVDNIPAEWDPIAAHQEVMFHIKPRRDDVTLTGFEITHLTHSELGPRVALTCTGGGNGARSGFNIVDRESGVKVTPTGAGVVNNRMQLYLDPHAGIYRIAAWFQSETARITEWEGVFVFRYGRDGGRRYRLPTGRVRTASSKLVTTFLEAKDGRWQTPDIPPRAPANH